MTGSLQVKNNKYYAVLNFKDNEGKRRQKWISLDMEVKNNKRKAEQALKKLVADYEAKKIDTINKQSFSDFMGEWLKIIKTSVKSNTYNNYELIYRKHIKPYFDKLRVTVTELTSIHIQNYYNDKIEEGLSASTVKRHHANIHKALDYALKMNIIPYNPADRITLPKREHYTGKFYDDIQLKRLMELCTNTPIESCVFLTINYGLRRSEALGLKWSCCKLCGKYHYYKSYSRFQCWRCDLRRHDKDKSKSKNVTTYGQCEGIPFAVKSISRGYGTAIR